MAVERRDVVGLGLVALMLAVSAVTFPALPDQLAIHFDAAGEPNDYLAKPLALALMPLLGLGLVAMFKLLPWLDPLGENFEAFQRYYDLVAVFVVIVLAYVHVLVIGWNLGYRVPMTRAVSPILAATYYVVGLVVEHAEQNWFVGIRTPWTLSSEEVWRRTHERTGVLFKLAGAIALLGLVVPEWFLVVAVAPAVLVAIAAAIYSFVLYRRLESP